MLSLTDMAKVVPAIAIPYAIYSVALTPDILMDTLRMMGPHGACVAAGAVLPCIGWHLDSERQSEKLRLHERAEIVAKREQEELRARASQLQADVVQLQTDSDKNIAEMNVELEKQCTALAVALSELDEVKGSAAVEAHEELLRMVAELTSKNTLLEDKIRNDQVQEDGAQIGAALEKIVESNNSTVAARCIRTVAIYVKNIVELPRDPLDEERLAKVCCLNSLNKPFQERVAACIGGKDLIAAIRFKHHVDGKYRLQEADALLWVDFFSDLQTRLMAMIDKLLEDEAEAQVDLWQIEYVHIKQAPGGALSFLAWEGVGDPAAGLAIYRYLNSVSGAAESAAQCWERLAAASQDDPRSTHLNSMFDKPALVSYDTTHNGRRRSYTVNLKELTSTNNDTGYTRSISFMRRDGTPLEAFLLRCGEITGTGEGRSRQTRQLSIEAGDSEAFQNESFELVWPPPEHNDLDLSQPEEGSAPEDPNMISAQDAMKLLTENYEYGKDVQVVAVRRVNVRPETEAAYAHQRKIMREAAAEAAAAAGSKACGTSAAAAAAAAQQRAGRTLPYNGDIQAAMRAQDRPAIRAIMEASSGTDTVRAAPGSPPAAKETLDSSLGVNEALAWHGSDVTGINGIVQKGFVNLGGVGKAKNANQFGIGVYLSPTHHPENRIMAADDQYSVRDKDGVKHMLLCSVLRGNVQECKSGSNAFVAEDGFHTGADRLTHPARYIVFQSQMNTNILPLYVVSFKLV